MPSPQLDPTVAGLAGLIDRLDPGARGMALTHSSWVEERIESYERLAFIGDSVLGLSVATRLYERFGDLDAGQLTKIHNQAVSGVSCASVGLLLGVPGMLLSHQPTTGRGWISAETLLAGERPLPEVTEALIGACYEAFGFEEMSKPVADAFESRIALAAETRIDFKSALQELLARRGSQVTYEVIRESGPPHALTFEVAAVVDGKQIGAGAGRSKKTAEQSAAEQALEGFEA